MAEHWMRASEVRDGECNTELSTYQFETEGGDDAPWFLRQGDEHVLVRR